MYGTTRQTRPPFRDNGGADHQTVSSSDSSSTEFRAATDAFQAFRPSLFVSLQSPPGEPSDETAGLNDTLPSLQDKSWIGARMSPINAVDHQQQDDDDDEDYHYFRRPQHATRQSHHHHQALPPFLTNAHPLAGHQRAEYPTFSIHPLQSSAYAAHPALKSPVSAYKSWWGTVLGRWGTVVCTSAGMCLLGMGIYDAYYGYYYYQDIDDDHGEMDLSHKWRWPWGQPSEETSQVAGGLIPSLVLSSTYTANYDEDDGGTPTTHSYWRLLVSALQCNSMVEFLLMFVGWFVVARPSIHTLSTATMASLYSMCTLTGQSWMLAVWWMTTQQQAQQQQQNQDDNNDDSRLVVHCAAWGTCGVLCFVGMLRPQRRFGCFILCIALVVVSLVQSLWCIPPNNSQGNNDNGNDNDSAMQATTSNPLPVVVGCIASAFCGWSLYGSQLLIPVHHGDGQTVIPSNNNNNKMTMMRTSYPHPNQFAFARRPHIPTPIRVLCAVLVVAMWMVPLLILSYFDYRYYAHGAEESEDDEFAATG